MSKKTITVELANRMQRDRNNGASLDTISWNYKVPKWVVSRYTKINPSENGPWTNTEKADFLWEWDFWVRFLTSGGKYRG